MGGGAVFGEQQGLLEGKAGKQGLWVSPEMQSACYRLAIAPRVLLGGDPAERGHLCRNEAPHAGKPAKTADLQIIYL